MTVWKTATDADGDLYYWNEKGESTYERPADYVAQPEPAPLSLLTPRGTTLSQLRTRKQEEYYRFLDGKGIMDHGRIEFPSSKKPLAQWVRVDASIANQPSTLEDLLITTLRDPSYDDLSADATGTESMWNLPRPSVIISVTGGAVNIDLDDKQKLIFNRGLRKAINQATAGFGGVSAADNDEDTPTTPWIVTGGTNYGVMELVGRAMQSLDDDGPQAPCIGIVPYGILSQRQVSRRAARMQAWTPVRHACTLTW